MGKEEFLEDFREKKSENGRIGVEEVKELIYFRLSEAIQECAFQEAVLGIADDSEISRPGTYKKHFLPYYFEESIRHLNPPDRYTNKYTLEVVEGYFSPARIQNAMAENKVVFSTAASEQEIAWNSVFYTAGFSDEEMTEIQKAIGEEPDVLENTFVYSDPLLTFYWIES